MFCLKLVTNQSILHKKIFKKYGTRINSDKKDVLFGNRYQSEGFTQENCNQSERFVQENVKKI